MDRWTLNSRRRRREVIGKILGTTGTIRQSHPPPAHAPHTGGPRRAQDKLAFARPMIGQDCLLVIITKTTARIDPQDIKKPKLYSPPSACPFACRCSVHEIKPQSGKQLNLLFYGLRSARQYRGTKYTVYSTSITRMSRHK